MYARTMTQTRARTWARITDHIYIRYMYGWQAQRPSCYIHYTLGLYILLRCLYNLCQNKINLSGTKIVYQTNKPMGYKHL